MQFKTSPKQNKSFVEATHRYNIWVGSIRAGKTYSSVRKFIDRLQFGVPGDAMICGVNRSSIGRNILSLMYDMIGFPAPTEKCMKTRLYGRDLYFVGAPDISAVATIKGATLAYAYIDEITEVPEPFFKMLDGRLSVPGAQLFGATNPDGPAHWFKKQYIDRKEELDLIHWDFNLDDNPILDKEYKKIIKASYTGLWFDRYILGKWALASGAIFPDFDHENLFENSFPTPNYYLVGIDYGTTNPTAAVLVAITPNKWPQARIEAEYYYDSAKTGVPKTDAQLVNDIKEFIGYRDVRSIYVDPAAASFKIALRQEDLPVIDANNDVLLGVKTMNKFISGRNIVVHKSCKNAIEQLQSYAWDSKYADRGEDKPVKKNDHQVDAIRYSLTPFLNSGDFGYADEQLNIENIRRKVYGNQDIYSNFNNEIHGGFC